MGSILSGWKQQQAYGSLSIADVHTVQFSSSRRKKKKNQVDVLVHQRMNGASMPALTSRTRSRRRRRKKKKKKKNKEEEDKTSHTPDHR